MQRDLKTYFGYDVSIEVRKVPCWRLIATPKAAEILKTHGGRQYQETVVPQAVYNLHNIPMSQLIQGIVNRTDAIVIDETKITDKIDVMNISE